MPRISVIMPVRNEQKTVHRAIVSVLDQDYADLEVIVIDDGSTDGTEVVVKHLAAEDPRVRYVTNEATDGQKSNVRAANIGLQLAQGEFICNIGGDDVYLPKRLKAQVEFLDANPNVGILFGWPRFMLEDGTEMPQEGVAPHLRQLPNRSRTEWAEILTQQNVFLGQTAMYRKAIHTLVGPFDERVHILADLDFYRRAVMKYDIHVMQQFTARICVRAGAISAIDSAERAAALASEQVLLAEKFAPINPKKFPWKGKVILATLFYDVRSFAPYTSSLVHTIALFERLGINYDVWEHSGDSYLDRGQDVLCERFLRDPEATDLILIESDHAWLAGGAIRLLRCTEPIVAISYPMKNAWESWTAVLKYDEHGVPLGRITDWGDTLIEAHAVSTGFIRFKREALLRWKEGYPDIWYYDNTVEANARLTGFFSTFIRDHVCYRNDYAFSVRWTELGEKLWVLPNFEISHIGTKDWKGNLDTHLRKLKKTQDETAAEIKAA